MIGMAGRGRVFPTLLWLLVRDEVNESSRGPGAMVSMAFLERILIVQCSEFGVGVQCSMCWQGRLSAEQNSPDTRSEQ